MTETTTDEVELVRMALAEVGYPDAEIRLGSSGAVQVSRLRPIITDDRNHITGYGDWSIPGDVLWKAFALTAMRTGCDISCWPCWSAHQNHPGEVDCDHDYLTEPWP